MRYWQLWNEPNAPFFWRKRPWERGYVQLLRVSRPVIKRADPRAKIVSGGFVGVGGCTPWARRPGPVRAGARRYVDAVAIHPFTHNPTLKGTVVQAELIIERIRTRINQRGRRRIPILLTEMAWPAAIPPVGRRPLGLSTTAKGQAGADARGLPQADQPAQSAEDPADLLVHVRRRRTTRTPTRRSSPSGTPGLMRYSGGTFSPMPILGIYASLPSRYAGCRKSTDARRCA